MNLSPNVQLLLYVVGSISVLFWVALLLVGPRRRQQGGADALQEERIRALLLALKKLQNGREHGGDDDNANIENRLILELARLYNDLGVSPNPTGSDPNCGACGGKVENHFHHCPASGAHLHASLVTSAA